MFSSFAYLIDGARILGMMLAAISSSGTASLSLVKSAEANIASWNLHLPPAKRHPADANGTMDEIMFRAHFIIHAYVKLNDEYLVVLQACDPGN